jgi:hypothetical protein
MMERCQDNEVVVVQLVQYNQSIQSIQSILSNRCGQLDQWVPEQM